MVDDGAAPMRCPEPLFPLFWGAVAAGHGGDRLDDTTVELDGLRRAAIDWALSERWAPTTAEAFGMVMVRRAKDRAVQERAWQSMGEGQRRERHALAQEVLGLARPCVAAPLSPAIEIVQSGIFRSQFHTGSSSALLDTDLRAMGEWAAFDIPVTADANDRPIYGFAAVGDCVDQRSVAQYGPVRFVLRDAVAERTTLTVGDSLNWHASAVPLREVITPRQASDASARRGRADWGRILVERGIPSYQDVCYFEVQIHGGVTIADVEEIVLARESRTDGDLRGRLVQTARAHRIAVRD